jgi:hypothetical protein
MFLPCGLLTNLAVVLGLRFATESLGKGSGWGMAIAVESSFSVLRRFAAIAWRLGSLSHGYRSQRSIMLFQERFPKDADPAMIWEKRRYEFITPPQLDN